MAKSTIKKWEESEKLLLLEAWARDGLTDEQIAGNMGITVRCLYNWKKKSVPIFQALKTGKEVADIEVENALRKKALGFRETEQAVSTRRIVEYENGKRVREVSEPVVTEVERYYPPDTTAQIFWLKNRKPGQWRDKREQEIDVTEAVKSLTVSETVIDFGKLIAPAFYPVHRDIVKGGHTYYDLYGGRGGLKSSFISLEIVLGMMRDSQANAAIFRKYAVTLRESVYEQILWAIDELGVQHLWTVNVSPMQCIYRPTGQKIIFRGLDKAKKTKSIKAANGYFKYLWFEELDEFAGVEEIRTVQQSVLRGGEKFVVFKSFNPPISASSWANVYVDEPRSGSFRHKSSYLDAPPEWLGQQFIDDAEHLKEVNEKAYRHEYLGEPVGTGSEVFEFLEIRTITDEEIQRFDRIYQGLDWGWYPDPMAFIRCHFNPRQEKIYLLDEFVGNKISNEQLARELERRKYHFQFETICDSAEPKSVSDLKNMGIWARAANKRPGSVEYGMKFLQRRTIVIDPARTPCAYKEITQYEYDRDNEGNLLSGYPDKNNHCIDALRYSLQRAMNSWESRA